MNSYRFLLHCKIPFGLNVVTTNKNFLTQFWLIFLMFFLSFFFFLTKFVTLFIYLYLEYNCVPNTGIVLFSVSKQSNTLPNSFVFYFSLHKLYNQNNKKINRTKKKNWKQKFFCWCFFDEINTTVCLVKLVFFHLLLRFCFVPYGTNYIFGFLDVVLNW